MHEVRRHIGKNVGEGKKVVFRVYVCQAPTFVVPEFVHGKNLRFYSNANEIMIGCFYLFVEVFAFLGD